MRQWATVAVAVEVAVAVALEVATEIAVDDPPANRNAPKTESPNLNNPLSSLRPLTSGLGMSPQTLSFLSQGTVCFDCKTKRHAYILLHMHAQIPNPTP